MWSLDVLQPLFKAEISPSSSALCQKKALAAYSMQRADWGLLG